MSSEIMLSDVYDKNINLLIGAGASFGLIPTLSLGVKDKESGESQTIETLATRFDADNDEINKTLLFMHYYKNCIEPAMSFTLEESRNIATKKEVLYNYRTLLETLVVILQRKKKNKQCNIFTTNYDGCFVLIADEMLSTGGAEFLINDGAAGFRNRYIAARNYSRSTFYSGAFDRHQVEVPQVNLIHLHGSVYWQKDGERIRVSYAQENIQKRLLKEDSFQKLSEFSGVLADSSKNIDDLPGVALTENEISSFWSAYQQLPIVNPTKWKFHETVFEEQYYQMLRLLSYELEKPDTVFISFGVSFADEHLLNLIKRSLTNPSLQLFVCCYDAAELIRMKDCFQNHRNVTLVSHEKDLNFSHFNSDVFSLNSPDKTEQAKVAEGETDTQ